MNIRRDLRAAELAWAAMRDLVASQTLGCEDINMEFLDLEQFCSLIQNEGLKQIDVLKSMSSSLPAFWACYEKQGNLHAVFFKVDITREQVLAFLKETKLEVREGISEE